MKSLSIRQGDNRVEIKCKRDDLITDAEFDFSTAVMMEIELALKSNNSMDKKTYILPIIKQKFHRGDLVRVNEPSNSWNGCFHKHGKEAYIVGSYADLCQQHIAPVNGVYTSKKYSLFFTDDGNTTSWYDEDVLDMIKERDINDVYRR